MVNLFMESIKKSLTADGVDIDDCNYKNSENYTKIKNDRISGITGGSMSLEEFIERYLLNEKEVFDTYDIKYQMGSNYEFYDDECEYEAVYKEIMSSSGSVSKDDIDTELDDFVYKFERTGGLIKRLNTYLKFDFDLFDKTSKRNRCEICKILYLFYMLEHKHFPKTNVLMLLSKPSMESIDNSGLGKETCNGNVIRFIKNSLEKELSLSAKEEIKTTVTGITLLWDEILNNVRANMDFSCQYNFDINYIDEIICSLLTEPKELEILGENPQYIHSPIETMYLKMVQHEFLGNIKDIAKTNNIKNDFVHNISPELVEEMKQRHYIHVDMNDVEKYITENAKNLSKYVYWKTDTSKEEVRKIRNARRKVSKLIDYDLRARPLLNIKDISNELQLISALQAIILDDQSETFDYIFYGYQNYMKRKPQVQGALKNDKSPVDSLQRYWVKKVTDRWYANIGRYDEKIKLRELENVCDNILEEILNKPNLNEMLETHHFYSDKSHKVLILSAEQRDAIQRLISYLHDNGFKYIDSGCKIRYAFLNPDEIVITYNDLIDLIRETVNKHEASVQISFEPHVLSGDKEIECDGEIQFVNKLSFELVFDYQNNECIMQ